MKNTKIYSCFPGTGKTHFYNNHLDSEWIVLDSDSSHFDKADFPANYIEHIKDNIGHSDIILVSSHLDVRQALFANGIPYELAYPLISCQLEYLNRYRRRGSTESFCIAMMDNWVRFIQSCHNDPHAANHHVLIPNQYLGDIIPMH